MDHCNPTLDRHLPDPFQQNSRELYKKNIKGVEGLFLQHLLRQSVALSVTRLNRFNRRILAHVIAKPVSMNSC